MSWRDGPGNKLDWVAIFPAGEPSLYGYIGFRYVGAPARGLGGLRAAGGLAPGRYVARLMLDDGYSVLAEAPFERRWRGRLDRGALVGEHRGVRRCGR